MWRTVTPSFLLRSLRRSAIRRSRRHRPDCSRLEERSLLSVTLADTAPPVPYVGTPVVWTAKSRGLGAKPVYRFSVGLPGGPFQVVRDFAPGNNFVWNPMQEGTFEIRVDVKPGYFARKIQFATSTYTAQTHVVGDSAVVSPTANPLVALYSAPPSSGASMYVQFAVSSTNPVWQNTSPLPVVPGESTNFLVAGMLPDTYYLMRHVQDNGIISGAVAFKTGSLPSYLNFPSFSVLQPPAAGIDPTHNLVFHAGLATGNAVNTIATDLGGNTVWYYDPISNGFTGLAANLEPGGTVTLLGGSAAGVDGGFNRLRQVDLAGNTLRETNINAMNVKLAAMHQAPIIAFDHEVKLLPNGQFAVLASTAKNVKYNGRSTRFVGNMVIVMDQNLQPTWVWNAFKWLNTNRIGTLGSKPNDWLHGNAISWSPVDSNLVVSFRSQDWAVKINYANGTGNGQVIWKLGAAGNFTPISNDPQPWFSHQHDVRYVNDNTIVVFDDSNLRHAKDANANSRGQEWVLDEVNKTATLVVNADLGNFSSFLGSAQLLPNGNLTFTSGVLPANGRQYGQSIQVLPNGTKVYVLQMGEFEYRSYFETSMYGAGLLN